MNFLHKIKDMASDVTGSSGTSDDWYITAVRAEGVRDADFWTKSDPYLKIEFGGKNVRTRVVKNDSSPNWNETFHFKLDSSRINDIRVWLMDDNLGLDDHLGHATVYKKDLPTFAGDEKFVQIPLYRKDQVTAVVHLRVKYVNDAQFSSSSGTTTTSTTTVNPNYQQQVQQQPISQQQPLSQQQPMSYDGVYNNPQPYNQGQFSQGDTLNQPRIHPHPHQQVDTNLNPNDNSNANYYGSQEKRF